MPDTLTFKTKDEIPAGLREHAEEKNGAFEVSVVSAKTHASFRQNNIDLLKERDELKGKLTPYVQVFGEDVTKAQEELIELRNIKQQVDDGTLKGSKAVEEAVAARVKSEKEGWETAKKAFDAQVQAAQQKAAVAEQKYKNLRLDIEVSNLVLAADSGFSPSALTDIQNRARANWRVADDGTLSHVDSQGNQVYSVKEPGTPMPMKEWLEALGKAAPHFLKPSNGGGATGGQSSGANFGMSQEAFQNLKPQDRLAMARAQQSR